MLHSTVVREASDKMEGCKGWLTVTAVPGIWARSLEHDWFGTKARLMWAMGNGEKGPPMLYHVKLSYSLPRKRSRQTAAMVTHDLAW